MHQAGFQTAVKTLWKKKSNKFSAIHGISLLLSLVVYTSVMDLNHCQHYCTLNCGVTSMSALEALLGFSPTVHIPQIKSKTVFFMHKASPTQWFTVSYNLTKISSRTIIPPYSTLPFWQSLALRALGQKEGGSTVWTAGDVFGWKGQALSPSLEKTSSCIRAHVLA